MKRHLKLVTFQGRTQTIDEWAAEVDIAPATLKERLRWRWPLERALRGRERARSTRTNNGPAGRVIEAHGRALTIREWAAELGVHRKALDSRLSRYAPEVALVRDFVGVGPGVGGRQPHCRVREAYAGANDTPWENDAVAQASVEMRGAHTLDEIAEELGCSRELVRLLEQRALRKLAKVLRRDKSEVVAMLRQLDETRAKRETVWPEPVGW